MRASDVEPRVRVLSFELELELKLELKLKLKLELELGERALAPGCEPPVGFEAPPVGSSDTLP